MREILRQVETSHTLPYFHNNERQKQSQVSLFNKRIPISILFITFAYVTSIYVFPDVTPSLQKDINRAIIYVPGSSHTYIQQNDNISQHISCKRYNKASTNVNYYINDKMSSTEYAEA